MFREVRRQGISYFTFSRLDRIPGLVHAFTSRRTDSCLRDAGDPVEVATKKDELLRVLDVQPARLKTVRQVHSSRVVRGAECSGAGPQADAILLPDPGLYGVIRTADCLPVLAVAPGSRSLCLMHAGWRGTRDHIVGKGVQRLLVASGATPDDVIVGFGPCIRACCYQVGEDVLEQFADAGHELSQVARGRNLDLAAANRADLAALGVTQILDAQHCTACHTEQFYSYRKLKDQGRMWLLAGFRDD